MASKAQKKRPRDVVLHDATYRVLVVQNDRPAHADDAIHAICLEQDLVGRGRDVATAIGDLSDTLVESLTEELRESLREYRKPPDAELLSAFEARTADYDGMAVLRRLHASLRIHSSRSAGNKIRLQPESVVFRPEPVAA